VGNESRSYDVWSCTCWYGACLCDCHL